jgi:hypothetical protein
MKSLPRPPETIAEASSPEERMFECDSWSNWYPDPERAFGEHDPALEPFASMSRDEVFEAMRDAQGGHEWEFLLEFVLDKCAPEELLYDTFLTLLRTHSEPEFDEFCCLSEAAGMATRVIVAPEG